MGLGGNWQISPLRLAHAYVELIHRRDEPGIREILAGLKDSARWGTGSAAERVLAGQNVLAKTGTAACRHMPRAPGDGFAVLLAPADQPELLLMVRVHGVPGSRAAFTAAQMLSQLEH
jgi:cell division protein FtsI/penicillin-binding protein 2